MLRYSKSHSVVLIAYHSINEYREDRIRVTNIVRPTIFEAQVQYLASTANIITLKEYLDHIEERKPILNKSVVVTFDDGYKDNLTIALPILQKYGVPATFFIATGYIGTGKVKWEDELSCVIRRSKKESISISLPTGNFPFDISSDKAKFQAIDYLVKVLSTFSQADRHQVLDQVKGQSDVKCDGQTGVMMSWDDVRQLANTPGFSIGSHTITHQRLTRISPDDVAFEITSSKVNLENEIGAPVALFAYPNGEFNQDVISAVQRAGYSCAVTIEYGKNDIKSDPYRLKRVLVPDQGGVLFKLGMWLRTSIYGNFLKNGYNTINNLKRNAILKVGAGTKQGY